MTVLADEPVWSESFWLVDLLSPVDGDVSVRLDNPRLHRERLTRLNGTSDAVGSVSHTLLSLVKAGFLRVGCDGLPKLCSLWSAKALRGLTMRTRWTYDQ